MLPMLMNCFSLGSSSSFHTLTFSSKMGRSMPRRTSMFSGPYMTPAVASPILPAEGGGEGQGNGVVRGAVRGAVRGEG